VQYRDSSLGREQQVSGVRVSVEEAMTIERADIELVESARGPFACIGSWPRLKEGVERGALAPAGSQDAATAPLQVDRRDGDRRMAGERLDETRLTVRLQRVVALLQEPALRFFEDRGDIDARSDGSSHDLDDRGRLEVRADRGVDAW